MRAALYDSYGPPDVLYVGRVPVPTLKPGQVLVRVHAASVNGGELYGRAGRVRLVTGRHHPGLELLGAQPAVWRPHLSGHRLDRDVQVLTRALAVRPHADVGLLGPRGRVPPLPCRRDPRRPRCGPADRRSRCRDSSGRRRGSPPRQRFRAGHLRAAPDARSEGRTRSTPSHPRAPAHTEPAATRSAAETGDERAGFCGSSVRGVRARHDPGRRGGGLSTPTS